MNIGTVIKVVEFADIDATAPVEEPAPATSTEVPTVEVLPEEQPAEAVAV